MGQIDLGSGDVMDGRGGGGGAVALKDAPDAVLIRRAREADADVAGVWRELRRRHLPSVVVYARLCIGEAYAEALAAEAFRRAKPALRADFHPEDALRLHLLLATVRTAASWATIGRRNDLLPDFTNWLDQQHQPGPHHTPPAPPITGPGYHRHGVARQAFYALPPHTRALLWHTLVDPTTPGLTATILGLAPDNPPTPRHDLLQRFRTAYLAHHAATAGEQCRRLTALLEATTRPGTARSLGDLNHHLHHCPHCSAAHHDLVRIHHEPRTLLAETLLPWAPEAYLNTHTTPTTRHSTEPPSAEPPPSEPPPSEPPDKTAAPRHHRRATPRRVTSATGRLALACAGLAIVATIAHVVDKQRTDHAASLANSSPGATAGPASSSPSRRPEPSPSPATMRPPSTTPSPTSTCQNPSGQAKGVCPSPSGQHSPSPPSPSPSPGTNAVFAEFVNAGSGLCLDVQGQVPEAGADLVVRTCNRSKSQKWKLTADGLIRNLADPGLCIDTMGSPHDVAAVWKCALSDSDPYRDSQLFRSESDGSVLVSNQPDLALAPADDNSGGVVVAKADQKTHQQWRLGRDTP